MCNVKRGLSLLFLCQFSLERHLVLQRTCSGLRGSAEHVFCSFSLCPFFFFLPKPLDFKGPVKLDYSFIFFKLHYTAHTDKSCFWEGCPFNYVYLKWKQHLSGFCSLIFSRPRHVYASLTLVLLCWALQCCNQTKKTPKTLRIHHCAGRSCWLDQGRDNTFVVFPRKY